MAECWVDVSASSTTTKYVLWTWGLSRCGQDGYNDSFGRENGVCVYICVCFVSECVCLFERERVCECVERVVQDRLPTQLPKPVSCSLCPQKWCVWGGSGIWKCYRFKSVFNKWRAIIIVTIKAQNHWWNLMNMTSLTQVQRETHWEKLCANI